MDSIIGLYRRDLSYSDLRIGTPDPNRYHDISSVNLELNNTPLSARVGHNHGFSGLRGVIIPRATRDGASRGHDHMVPKPAYIDPELTNRRLIVDPMKIVANPEAMVEAIQSAYANYHDPADATVAAYAAFAEQLEELEPTEISIPQPQSVVPTPISNPSQQPTGHGPNTYVTPHGLPSGGQAKIASFAGVPQQPGFGPSSLPKPTPPPSPPVHTAAQQPPSTRQGGIQRSVQAVRSLRGEFDGQPSQAAAIGGNRPMRKITFELPGMGQFPCLFHDVVKQDDNLVLVYDHSHPAQHIWFPPILEDPQNKEPVAIAVMVDSTQHEPPMLYLAYPTGVRFMYRQEEFCLLTIEKEKRLDNQVG
jgi:hypothetical protein